MKCANWKLSHDSSLFHLPDIPFILLAKAEESNMSLEIRTFICKKCGKTFRKAVGGVIMTPKEMELTLNPVCDQCKAESVKNVITGVFDFFK